MIYIDYENRTPMDTDIDGWEPWSEKKWNDWLEKSKELLDKLEKLNRVGKIKERNKLIDKNKGHWGNLKPWLKQLSKGKCWFSEVRDLYSHWDVEHFRPKKLAKSLDGYKHDGYWWLAFDYTNYRLCGNVGNRKKGNRFPLKKESDRSTYAERCEESEAPYLIDPINILDVMLIAFNEEGDVIPAPGISKWDKKRVEESIEILKLNEHEPLTEARKKVWQEITREIDLYKKALSRDPRGNNPVARNQAKNHLRKIRSMTRRDAELSSVAKWCVSFKNDPKLTRLVA